MAARGGDNAARNLWCPPDHPYEAHNLTNHKWMVSTMVCGPFGGIYPYPSQILRHDWMMFDIPVIFSKFDE